MNYTLDRYRPREDNHTDVLEMVKEALTFSTMAGSLERLMVKRRTKDRHQARAKRAMLMFMASQETEEEAAPSVSNKLLAKLLGRVLKKAGKWLVKRVVRPILQFAARAAMTLIRFAATAILRYVLVPIMSAIAAFAVANPLTAAAIALAAAAGGAYYAYKKLTGSTEVEEAMQAPQTPQEIENVEQAEAAQDVAEVGAQAQVEGSAQQQIETAAPVETTMIEQVKTTAGKAVEKVKEFVAPKKGKKFTGFGADVDSFIVEATQRYPILPLDDFRGFVKMEAGWTGAMSPTGAIGTGQFIQPTWDALAATPEGKAIGMTKIGKRFRQSDDPRRDKRINTLATGLLASQNAKMLKAKGIPITGENLYMMHNIGPGIIPVMLGQPASAQTLKAMQQNGMLKGMTAEQFLEFQKGRFRRAYAEANDKTYMGADQAQIAKAVTLDAQKKNKVAAASATQAQSGSATKKGTDLIRGPGNSIVRA